MGVAIFATQNMNLVTIVFLNLRSIPVPLGLVLVCCGGLGGLCFTICQKIDWGAGEPPIDTTYRYTPPRSKPKVDDWEEPWSDDWG